MSKLNFQNNKGNSSLILGLKKVPEKQGTSRKDSNFFPDPINVSGF